MKSSLIACVMALAAPPLLAQDRQIEFPDVPPYLTLTCDFHMHSVFSDGSVWPNIRVQEAHRDGLDAIAMTDHLEYQPHEEDIPHPDRNRSYAIALDSNGENPLIVLNGSEITRDMPPGHSNAIFLQDVNRLLMDDAEAVFQEANRQGGFVFWNHPNWTSQRASGMAELTDMHRHLIGENLLHGVEVVNEGTYSDEALQIALDHNLAILGTSDIHGLVDWQFDVPGGGHRPVTLVFASSRSAEGIKEALDARRTVAWHNNTLIGRERDVIPLIQASLTIAEAFYRSDTSVLTVSIANSSDVTYLLRNLTDYSFHLDADIVTVQPHTTTRLDVKTLDKLSRTPLSFEVLNAVTAPDIHPQITLEVVME